MADVFVSSARDDRELAKRVVALLEAQGWSVWWDTRIIGGERWDAVIEHEIEAARCVVVLWTPHSLKREWVNAEAHHGHSRGILVSTLVDVSKPPLAFSLRQAHNLTRWDGTSTTEEVGKFLKAVWEKLEGTSSRKQLRSLPQPHVAASGETGPRRRTGVGSARGSATRWFGTAALAVLMLVAGVLIYRLVAPRIGVEVRPQQGEADKAKAGAAETARQEEIKGAAEAAGRKKAEEEAQAKRAGEEAEHQRLAALKAEEDRKRAETTAKKKAEEEAQAKREAEEAERRHLTMLNAAAEEDRKRAEAEAKRKTDQAGSVQRIVGEWRGTYLCAQGRTGATVTIESKGGQKVTAIFELYPIAENPGVPRGTAFYEGVFESESRSLRLDGSHWKRIPASGWIIVAIEGRFDSDFRSFSGRKLNPSCGDIQLTRSR